jgi:hypothetical protein
MIGLLIGVGIVTILFAGAWVVYAWNDSTRSQQFEDHLDENFEAITEYRIRRTFNQGG